MEITEQKIFIGLWICLTVLMESHIELSAKQMGIMFNYSTIDK